MRATVLWCRTRSRSMPRDRRYSSASAICARASTVTGVPYGIREDRQACAGLSHVGSPIARERSRISDFVSPASTSGLRTPRFFAELMPGRKSPVSSRLCALMICEYSRFRQGREVRVQLFLAEEAAIGIVNAVIVPLHLRRLDDAVVQTKQTGHFDRPFELRPSEARRPRGNG